MMKYGRIERRDDLDDEEQALIGFESEKDTSSKRSGDRGGDEEGSNQNKNSETTVMTILETV